MRQNHFELFQLQPRFGIDLAQLERAYREVQNQVHPDKFVTAGTAEQRVAMQWATHANTAYQTLKNPLKRATYLCELNGVDLQAESNTAMPVAFLMQQMEWRERLDDVRSDLTGVQELESALREVRNHLLAQIGRQLDNAEFQDAAQSIRQLMFLEKFNDDLDRVTDQLVQ